MNRTDKERKGERQANLEDKPVFGAEGQPAQPSSSGGRVATEAGSRDTLKRSRERPAGATRVQGRHNDSDNPS